MNMDIEYLLLLQRAREAMGGIFDSFFLEASEFATLMISFLVFAGIYWCIDKQAGIAIGWNIGIGCTLNTTLKKIFRVDRPWIRDDKIQPVERALPDAGGYSFPSGHTTRAMASFGVAGTCAFSKSSGERSEAGDDRKLSGRLIGMVCWFIVLMVAFSRNWLGVHTPQDVIISFILGIIVMMLVRYTLLLADRSGGRYDLVIAACGAAICFIPMLRFGCMGNCGAGMGVFAGWYIERHFIGFSVEGDRRRRILRFTAGAIPLVFICKVIQPFLTLFILEKYAGFFMQLILSLYITVVYPFLFKWAENAAGIDRAKRVGIIAASIIILVLITAILGHVQNYALILEAEPAAEAQTTDTDVSEFVNTHVDIIGHRGYPAVAPENTMPSFEAALELGVDWIETDVQLTKDGVLVLFHDNNLKRITGAEGTVADYTYDELKQMDFGNWFSAGYAGTSIPTMQELFDLIRDSDVRIYLELKDIGDVEGFTKAIYDTVESSGLHDRVVYASFNYGYLQELKEIDSGVQILLNTSSGSLDILTDTPADYYGLNVENVTTGLIKAIHEIGKKVFVWTPDNAQQIHNLQRMGVDGVCSNQVGIAMIATRSEYSFVADNAIWSHAMPGLYETDLPNECSDMVWQGFTRTGSNLISAAYSKSGNYNSVFYIMDLKGKLQNVVDAGFKAHMGGIGYDVNHDILWSTGPDGMVFALSMAAIKDGSYNGERLAEFDAKLYNTNGEHVASFLTVDGNFLYVGSYCDGGNGTLNRYDISNPNEPQLITQVTIPERIQGVTLCETADGNRQLMMTQGYQTDDGQLLIFLYDDSIQEYLTPDKCYTLPEGPEQILWTNKGLYIQFESAALPYRDSACVVGDQLWLIQLPK